MEKLTERKYTEENRERINTNSTGAFMGGQKKWRSPCHKTFHWK
jgi:hypothetical protein